MNIKQDITQLIKQALNTLDIAQEKLEIELERPANKSFGDFSSNVAMMLLKKQDQFKSPRDLAQAIVDQMQSLLTEDSLVAKVDIAGPGFINFTLKDDYYVTVVKDVLKKQGKTFKPATDKQKIIVEYSSPNIAKPFTVGHLRSTIIGDAIANLLEAVGHTVYRDNHLGDWGTQFGKQIYAIKTWGDEAALEKSEKPVKELVDLYVKFHQEAEKNPDLNDEGRKWFKKLEDGDEEARGLWQKCIDWSWKEFTYIYQKLGIKFTENDGRGYGESFFEDKMEPIIKELTDKGLLKESKGAQVVFFPEDKYPPAMILKQDGATLYHTRDLATDKFRLEKYGADVKIINEVGSEQKLYFEQLFEMEKMLGWVKEGQRIHVKHGMFRFSDKKMSTRKGNVIWLDEVLNEAFDRIKKIAKDRINDQEMWKIAVGAIKWNDLKKNSELNVVFDWDEILRVDGNSGPYMQYSYTRCFSVLEQAQLNDNWEYSGEINAEEKTLMQQLSQFDEAVNRAIDNLAPHHVCIYLYELAQSFNGFYNKHSILKADNEEQKQFRLALTKATAEVIKRGLGLLGIETLEKM